MSITKKEYGIAKTGETVYSYTLDNGNGLSADIITYGGIVTNLYAPDKDGNKVDVVIGRNNLEEYFRNDGYVGALIGRHANRIAGSKFELNGETYVLNPNENANNLHGGLEGFDKKVWNAAEGGTDSEPALILTLHSPDGDEGFPGNLDVTVTYTLTAENALKIEYKAVSDKDTVVNMTNHSYFNLAGHDSGTIDNQLMQINSSFYTPNDAEGMPTGEILSVTDTTFDFRKEKAIGGGFTSGHPQIELFNGYDHNFVIDGYGMRFAAKARCAENGITMAVYTNLPSMQLYTSNGLPEANYKNGAKGGLHAAFCLETQCFPNAMKYLHYPNPILKAGEEYHAVTEYKFGIEE